MRGRLLALGGTLAAAALLMAPVASGPASRMLGHLESEAATHAPVLAAALAGLSTHGPFVYADHPLAPDHVNQAMLEPITILGMAPIWALVGGVPGFTLAWNLWLLAGVLAAGAGAWIGARAWLGDDDARGWGAGLAATLAACSLFHHLACRTGRTETFAWAFYGLHLGLLVRAARRGGWGLAAASVVPVVWAGGYATVFAALADAGVVLWLVRGRHALRGAGVVALTAAAAAVPLAWALYAHPYAALGERIVSPSVDINVLVAGAPLLTRVLPGYEVAPFVGWVTLLAAGLAVSRRAVGPLAIGLALLGVAAGPAPTLVGQELPGPAALLAALPGPFGLVRCWPRIVAFAVPFLAIAAARAGARHPALAVGLAVAVLVETGVRTRGEATWTLESARAVELRAAGEIPLQLPLDGYARARRWLAPPEGPDPWTLAGEPLPAYLEAILPMSPKLLGFGERTPSAGEVCALRADAYALRRRGYTGLLLHVDESRLVDLKAAQRALRELLGNPPTGDWWPLPVAVDPACVARDIGVRDAHPLTPEERTVRQAERRRLRSEAP